MSAWGHQRRFDVGGLSAIAPIVRVRSHYRERCTAVGPIGILNLLSERVGQKGVAVGLEYVPGFAEMARAEVARRGLTNVEVVQADALSSALERNYFLTLRMNGW